MFPLSDPLAPRASHGVDRRTLLQNENAFSFRVVRWSYSGNVAPVRRWYSSAAPGKTLRTRNGSVMTA
jgi:hypothetical protein